MDSKDDKDKPLEWWDPPNMPTKKERQEAFRRQCAEEGLSVQEALERASFFPILPPEQMRIVHCPDLPEGIFRRKQQ